MLIGSLTEPSGTDGAGIVASTRPAGCLRGRGGDYSPLKTPQGKAPTMQEVVKHIEAKGDAHREFLAGDVLDALRDLFQSWRTSCASRYRPGSVADDGSGSSCGRSSARTIGKPCCGGRAILPGALTSWWGRVRD